MATDPHPTPTALLARVREVQAVQRAAEVELVVLATGWADAHPDLEGTVDPADPEVDPLVPAMDWRAGAAFAAALGLSTAAGEALVRDALTLRHRLPRVWSRLLAGALPVWRARRIARAVHARPADVADWLDETLAPIAATVGAITLDRLVDEAMLLLYAEERELEQLEALDARHATLHEASLNHTGIAEMTLRGDWADLADFDRTLSDLAALLDPVDPFEVRRSRAVGVLADPATAAALLAGAPAPTPRRATRLVVHVAADAVAGLNPLARDATAGRAVLEQQVRAWCGRTDTHLQVLPVVDLTEHVAVDRYEVGDRLRTRAALRATLCVFPWCTRPARSCDCRPRRRPRRGRRHLRLQPRPALPATSPAQDQRRMVLHHRGDRGLALVRAPRPTVPPRPHRHPRRHPTRPTRHRHRLPRGTTAARPAIGQRRPVDTGGVVDAQ